MLCLFCASNAQTVEDLRVQLINTNIDTAKARISGALAYKLLFTDSVEAERLITEEVKLAGGAPLLLADAYRSKALLYIIHNKRIQGLAHYDTAIAFAIKAKSAYYQASCLALIAGFYQDMGDYDRSLQYYFDALRVAELGKETKLTASTCNNIATVYAAASRDRRQTLHYYHRALHAALQMKNFAFAGLVAINLAAEYMHANKRDSTEKMLQSALNYAGQSAQRGYEYAVVMTGAGNIYEELGRYQTAESFLRDGLSVQDSLKRPINAMGPLSSLCALLVKQKRWSEAELLVERLLQDAIKYETKIYIREAYRLLSDMAKEKKQLEKALEFKQQQDRWNDSIFNETRQQSIANVQARAELAQRELEVKYETNEKASENRWLRIIVAAASVVLLLLIILLWLVIRAHKKQEVANRELQEKNALIDRQAQEKDTLMLEIHHRVKNNLQIVSSLLNLQANTLTDEKAIAALRESHNRVKSISLIHQKLYSQEALSAIYLEEYIVQLYTHLKQVFNAPHIDFQCSAYPPHFKLSMDHSIPLGVILNELITNSIKYAQINKSGGQIRIVITDLLNGQCSLCYSDNGVGLPDGFDIKSSTSLGMRIVSELSRQMRGVLTVTSDAGTQFKLVFPLKK